MSSNVDAQVAQLHLSDHGVIDDERHHLQSTIHGACCAANRDEQSSRTQTPHNSFGTYSLALTSICSAYISSTEDKLLKPVDFLHGTLSSNFYEANETSIKTTVPAVASAVGTMAIDNGVRSFSEGSKILMKALDGISQVHPFIAGNHYAICVYL